MESKCPLLIALSRKERDPPLRVRALVMTISLDLPKQILNAQTEARKPENIKSMSWLPVMAICGRLIIARVTTSRSNCYHLVLEHKTIGLVGQPEIPQWKVGTISQWNFVTKASQSSQGLADCKPEGSSNKAMEYRSSDICDREPLRMHAARISKEHTLIYKKRKPMDVLRLEIK
ncbi:hypothetical protein Tco_0086688 [Tanacetum coccineum]